MINIPPHNIKPAKHIIDTFKQVYNKIKKIFISKKNNEPIKDDGTIGFINYNYNPALISMNDSNSEIIFKIESDGTIYFRKNSKLVKVEDEKDLSMLFVMVISEYSGGKFNNKEELFARIVSNYRKGKIDDILSDN